MFSPWSSEDSPPLLANSHDGPAEESDLLTRLTGKTGHPDAGMANAEGEDTVTQRDSVTTAGPRPSRRDELWEKRRAMGVICP